MKAVDGRKTCSKCRESKPVAEFARLSRASDGLQLRCRPCHSSAMKDSAQRHREKRRAYIRRTAADLRAWVNTLKAAPCTDCGGTFPPVCMDWDHIGTDKMKDVSVLVREKRPRTMILAEIAKCELVCSNCHRLRTQERRN